MRFFWLSEIFPEALFFVKTAKKCAFGLITNFRKKRNKEKDLNSSKRVTEKRVNDKAVHTIY